MIEGIEIEKSGCYAYDNAQHALFHQKMVDTVKASDFPLEEIHITDGLLAEWQENIALETDICKESTKSADTETLAQLEAKRDALLINFFQFLRAAVGSALEEESEPAKELMNDVGKYADIHTAPVDAETLYIRGLLVDLHKEGNWEKVVALGLDPKADMLEETNNEYYRLQDKRTDEMLKARIADLAVRMNSRIANARSTYNQIMGLKSGAGSGMGSATRPEATNPPTLSSFAALRMTRLGDNRNSSLVAALRMTKSGAWPKKGIGGDNH